jgi:D-3-phosphoglycerate dehydrogenase / 2-oxoglutarate reductase
MKTVLITEPIHADALARLAAEPGIRVLQGHGMSPEAMATLIAQADAIACRTYALKSTVLAHANTLSVVAKHGVGCDHIDVAYCTQRGIPVLITSQANKVSVAEQAFMYMLALSKDVVGYDRAVRHGHWAQRFKLKAFELKGRTLLVVGFGRIGREVAARARAFGMRVIVVDIAMDTDLAGALGCEIAQDFRAVLPEADILTLHVPKTPSTAAMMGRAEFNAMKPGALFINCARGGLVDETALAYALKHGPLAAAGLDVFEQEPVPTDHPLLQLPNVLISPHSAASTVESGRAMGMDTVDNILAAFAGQIDPANIFNPGYDEARR